MKWIRGLSNSDTTGDFYDAHKSVSFSDLYADIYSSIPKYGCEEGKKPDGKSCGTALNSNKYDGYTYVLFIRSDSNESTFKTFYSNVLTSAEQKHFYVIDFREDENKESEYNLLKKNGKTIRARFISTICSRISTNSTLPTHTRRSATHSTTNTAITPSTPIHGS